MTDPVILPAETRVEARRRFLTTAARTGVALGGVSLLAACGGGDDGSTATPTPSPTPSPTPTPTSTASVGPADYEIFGLAINFVYLLAQFYTKATGGTAIADAQLTGGGTQGTVTGGATVAFSDPVVAQFAREIAADKKAHLSFLRTALGAVVPAQPKIDIAGGDTGAFTALMRKAGIVGANAAFDPYANDTNFLLSAFVLEDVLVTGLKGAAALMSNQTVVNQTYLEAAAGALATTAYHAGMIRTLLYRKGLYSQAEAISDARDSLDGSSNLDRGIGDGATANLTPADADGIAFSRTVGQILNIAYLNASNVVGGGFFPSGVNGNIKSSANSTPS